MMRVTLLFSIFFSAVSSAFSQETLSLERCRELALSNNKQLAISRVTADIAENAHKTAKTKYLPRVTGMAGYEHLSREISLLSDKQKETLSSLGSTTVGKIGGQIGESITQFGATRHHFYTSSATLRGCFGQYNLPTITSGQ